MAVRARWTAVVFGGIMLATGPAAGIDCLSPLGADQRLICATPELEEIQRRLEIAHQGTLAAAGLRGLAGSLRRNHGAWIERRNRICGLDRAVPLTSRVRLVACLDQALTFRIDALDRMQADLETFGVLIEMNRITEADPKRRLEVEVYFPLLDELLPGATEYNAFIVDHARIMARGFVDGTDPLKIPLDRTARLLVGYLVTYASPHLVSIQFGREESDGTDGPPRLRTRSVHFDLARRRPVAAEDFFKPDSGWEKAVAAHAAKGLRQPVPEGVLPAMVTDLARWSLEEDRALLWLAPEEAEDADGEWEVAVPYTLLRPLLQPEAPIPPRR